MQIPQETRFDGYFGLDRLYNFIRWLEGFIYLLEELISVLSGPLLAIGLSFSLVDFLMLGSLLKDTRIALAWAIVQAASVDAQLVLMWHKSKLSMRQRNRWSFIGFVILGIALAFVAFGAVALQSLQQSAGMDSARALHSLGLTAEEMVYARSAVAIILACVAGWTRSPIGQGRPVQMVTSQQQKENKRPGFFARKWSVFLYWFELRKAIKQAQKNQDQLPEKLEENQANSEPEIEEEMLPEIADPDIGDEQEIIDTEPAIYTGKLPALLTENFGDFIEVDPLVESCDTVWSFTEFPMTIASEKTSEMKENQPEKMPGNEEVVEDSGEQKEPDFVEGKPSENQEQLRIRQQRKYAPTEAVKLPICQQNNISAREIKKAIADGKLRANQEGKVSKSALETWVKSLRLVA